MESQRLDPLPVPTPLTQRTQHLRELWQALPAYVSAFTRQSRAAT